MMSGIQCVECGRFLGEADFAAGHVYYEPESEFGHERIEWSCRRHGIPTRATLTNLSTDTALTENRKEG